MTNHLNQQTIYVAGSRASVLARRGFTLIELLIVIAIIAILAAILFTSIGQSPLVKSRDSARAQSIDSTRTALALYYSSNNKYPDTLDTLVVSGQLSSVPKDPRAGSNSGAGNGCTGWTPNVTGTGSGVAGAWVAGDFGFRYAVDVAGRAQAYVLQACVEGAPAGNNLLTGDCQNLAANPACTDPAAAGTARVYDVHS